MATSNRFAILRETHWRKVGMRRLAWHVEESPQRLDYDFAKGGKLPRNHIYRPYRFAVQDIVFGITVVRHAREINCLEVDVFLTAKVPQYELDSGVKILTLFLLSEAFKCGGSMEIRFTEFVEGKRIPSELCELARNYGMPLEEENIRQGRIPAAESVLLFSKLTAFSDVFRSVSKKLTDQGIVSIERMCYLIHQGIWSLQELESIVLSAQYPNLVLSGDVQPEEWHLYTHAIFHARSALLGDYFEQAMSLREHLLESGGTFDLEDDKKNIQITLDGAVYKKTYLCPDEEISIPWTLPGNEIVVPANKRFHVFLRARNTQALLLDLEEDINFAGDLKKKFEDEKCFLLIPYDYFENGINARDREKFEKTANSKGVSLLVSPESTITLDNEARNRLTRSRILRE